MCKYCENGEFVINTLEKEFDPHHIPKNGDYGITVSVDGGLLCVEAIADTYEPSFEEASTKINYCPMCGRKFEE